MSDNSHSIIIRAGSDPRQLPEFSAIREEINKINHPARPEVNWSRIESLALTLFASNGVDLQTAVYYSLARTQRHGLAGFTESCELLASVVVSQWERLWPQQELARTEILEWFNARVGNQLRQHPFTADDLRQVYRAERALQLLCDKLQQVPLTRVPRVANLLYLIQNSAKRLEAEHKVTPAPSASAAPILVFLSATDQLASDMAANKQIPRDLAPHFAAPGAVFAPALWGFTGGVLLCLLIAAGVYLMEIKPMQRQLAALAGRPEAAVQLWVSQPELSTLDDQITRLENLSPLSALRTADRSLALVRERWPNDGIQLAASQRWEQTIQTRLGATVSHDSYFQLQQQLQALSQKLIEQERLRGSLTISWLKTAVYQMQSELNREMPIEELLRQLSVATEHDKPAAAALTKQINDRLNSLLSRYYQLTQQM